MKPGLYTCSPCFGNDSERASRLTRAVRVLGVRDGLIEVEEVTSGPPNGWGKDGRLWTAGDKVLREPDRWTFTLIDLDSAL